MSGAPSTIEGAAAAWRNRNVVVIGAGRSGIAAAHLLFECGARVTITDLRPAAELAATGALSDRGVEVVAGSHPATLWTGADAAIISPGIPLTAAPVEQARAAGMDVLAEIELAAAFIDVPIIAITGSNGKSTVTSMVGSIFDAAERPAAVCGNIGTALSTAVHRQMVDDVVFDAYIVEISSFQSEAIEHFHPHYAALLNIQEDHLDRHGSLEAYARAKLRLTLNMTGDDWLVCNQDDPELQRYLPVEGPQAVTFARRPDDPVAPMAWADSDHIWWWQAGSDRTRVMALEELNVIGPHNEANACAATALAALAGIDTTSIAAGLRRYRPLEHRMERCGEVHGVICINDSKATNVDATAAALSGFDAGVWLILGGRDKGADFAQLSPLMAGRVERVLLIGEAASTIAAALAGVQTETCETMQHAVAHALEQAGAGDTLLLSPACTSFDQYSSFEERGAHFKALVAKHAAGAAERGAHEEVQPQHLE